MSATLEKFLNLLEAGRDSALLRFSLGNEYLKIGDARAAAAHLRQAVVLDPAYSAAWKRLGAALEAAGELAPALEAYREGIAVAGRKGDQQAAREMTVFARRVEKRLQPPES